MSVSEIFENLEHRHPTWVCFKTPDGNTCINLRHARSMVYRNENREVEVRWIRDYKDVELLKK